MDIYPECATTRRFAMSSPALQTLFPEPRTTERPVIRSPELGLAGIGTKPAEGFVTRLGRMTPQQRLAVYRAGGFTRHERAVWACRYPDEVPTVNGEFEWLVLRSADLD